MISSLTNPIVFFFISKGQISSDSGNFAVEPLEMDVKDACGTMILQCGHMAYTKGEQDLQMNDECDLNVLQPTRLQSALTLMSVRIVFAIDCDRSLNRCDRSCLPCVLNCTQE